LILAEKAFIAHCLLLLAHLSFHFIPMCRMFSSDCLFSSAIRQLLDEMCVLCNRLTRDFKQSARKLAAFWAMQVILEFLKKPIEGILLV
jgi:hypothetical protein